MSVQRVPGGMPCSGNPSASSYEKPHPRHIRRLKASSVMTVSLGFRAGFVGTIQAAFACPRDVMCDALLYRATQHGKWLMLPPAKIFQLEEAARVDAIR